MICNTTDKQYFSQAYTIIIILVVNNRDGDCKPLHVCIVQFAPVHVINIPKYKYYFKHV